MPLKAFTKCDWNPIKIGKFNQMRIKSGAKASKRKNPFVTIKGKMSGEGKKNRNIIELVKKWNFFLSHRCM